MKRFAPRDPLQDEVRRRDREQIGSESYTWRYIERELKVENEREKVKEKE